MTVLGTEGLSWINIRLTLSLINIPKQDIQKAIRVFMDKWNSQMLFQIAEIWNYMFCI